MSRQTGKLIVAVDRYFGIGKGNTIPWRLRKDMQRFAKLTQGDVADKFPNQVIMGKNTYLSIPKKFRPLSDRVNIVVSTTLQQEDVEDGVVIARDFNEAISHPLEGDDDYTATRWIIGGETLYRQALVENVVDEVELTYIDKGFDCDTFFPIHLLNDFRLEASSSGKHPKWGPEHPYQFLTLKKNGVGPALHHLIPQMHRGETGYLVLLDQLLAKAERGEWRETRNGRTVSTFSHPLTFDLSRGFPLLTTKRMFWRGVAEELFFFLKGDTNAKHLSEKKVRIWDGNTTEEFLASRGLDYKPGDMGPMYGWQWRYFGAEYEGCDHDYTGEGFDQLRDLLTRLTTNPTDRRLLMTTFNPADVPKSVLAPCHSLTMQFYVETDGRLSVSMYQRSADIFLGVPFNIASTALLTGLIAHLTGLTPGMMTITFGDLHLYEEHMEAARTQLSRTPHLLPQLSITKEIEDGVDPVSQKLAFLESLTMNDLKLENYVYDPPIRAAMKA